MKTRFTNYELEKKSDQFILKTILSDRMGDLDRENPLFKRLKKLRNKIESNEPLTANLPEDFKDGQGR